MGAGLEVGRIPSERLRDDDIVDMGLVLGRCRKFINERLSTQGFTEEEEKRANTLLDENLSLRTDVVKLGLGLTRYWIEFYGVPVPYVALHESLRDHRACAPQEKRQMMVRIDEHILRCRTLLPNGIRSDLRLYAAFEPL